MASTLATWCNTRKWPSSVTQAEVMVISGWGLGTSCHLSSMIPGLWLGNPVEGARPAQGQVQLPPLLLLPAHRGGGGGGAGGGAGGGRGVGRRREIQRQSNLGPHHYFGRAEERRLLSSKQITCKLKCNNTTIL